MCPECSGVYEAIHKSCPYCDYYPEPAGRSLPEQVDGDLIELTPEALAQMRGEIDNIDKPAEQPKRNMLHAGAAPIVAASAAKNQRIRQEVQSDLRKFIALWSGIQVENGLTDSQQYRRFYHLFGVDIMTAQTFGKNEAAKLQSQIMECITHDYFMLQQKIQKA